MFRRIREEDYDEYNERINSKYDDDYIRPTKESRSECTHSHEQSYENYDVRETHAEYREECGHSHEQTYEDYNSEQKSYDEQSSLEDKFAKNLMPNEQIIWCGRPEKNITPEEAGTGCVRSACIMMIVFAAVTFPLFTIMSVMIIGFSIYIMNNTDVKRRSYAITTSRILINDRGKLRTVSLKNITNITYKSSSRNIGYVMFAQRNATQTAGKQFTMNDGIFGIKDPAAVSAILQNAVRPEYNRQGVR